MKIAPQDITPEMLQTALREIMAAKATTEFKKIGKKVAQSMTDKESLDLIHDIVTDILSEIDSCHPPNICYCQLLCMFSVAFTCGVLMSNAHQDVAVLREML